MTKPFNLADAKAGHPVCTAYYEVTLHDFAFELKTVGLCLMGVAHSKTGGFPIVGYWLQDGREHPIDRITLGDLVMAPIGTIDGKPVYPGDMITAQGISVKAQHDVPFPIDAKWPREYPLTQMDQFGLTSTHNLAYVQKLNGWTALQAVANAAIRHGIDNGYLLDPREQQTISIKLPEMSPEDLQRIVSGDTGRASIIYDQGPITYGDLQKLATALGIHRTDSFEDVKDKIKRRERAILWAGVSAGHNEAYTALYGPGSPRPAPPVPYNIAQCDELIAKVK